MNRYLAPLVLAGQLVSVAFFSDRVPAYATEDTPQPGYTTSTLRDPIFDTLQVALEATTFNNWLIYNYESLTEREREGVREHLYYLIDSRIKALYLEKSVVLPEEHDILLDLLFSWAEPLGIYGGSLAFNAVNAPDAPDRPSLLTLPESMALSLEDDLFTVSSSLYNWQFDVPYYFMIWAIDDSAGSNGMQAQRVVLSTGVAEDTSPLGHSQATILFMFFPEMDKASVTQFLSPGLGISDNAERLDLNGVEHRSYYEFDEVSRMHTELTTWDNEAGAYAITFLGADGTYQWNRPHFLDFVRSLDTGNP